ncbi:MAG: hypothetical protein FJ318_06040 [SAR202 cluster bacterium]|nr:hypothetical protein [SAR202 cluster bacterium]
MNTALVLSTLADRLREVAGIRAAYSQGDDGANGLPDGLTVLPCVVVSWAGGLSYEQHGGGGMHRYTFLAAVQLFVGDPVLRLAGKRTLTLFDAIVTKMVGEVTLGGDVTYARILPSEGGFRIIPYGGADDGPLYWGTTVSIELSVAETVTYAAGTA